MDLQDWIKAARSSGWRVRKIKPDKIELHCAKIGCPGTASACMDHLGDVPEPCDLPHHASFAEPVYAEYRALVDELRQRRVMLGLSQEDLNATIGLAEGHLSKLESFHKTVSFPTLQLWIETLGLQLTLAPAEMPTATRIAIKARQGRP